MAGDSEKEKKRHKVISSARSLHNFILPSRLSWGHQKHLRCISVGTNSNSGVNSTPHRRAQQSIIPIPVGEGVICSKSNESAINVTTAMTVTEVSIGTRDCLDILENKERDSNPLETLPSNPENKEKYRKAGEEELPWNLRTRAGRASNEGSNTGWSLLHCSYQKRLPFSIPISKKEIETDFLLMTGAKPPRRPKRRPRSVQKQVEASFPGSWLTEITPETYGIRDIRS